MTRLSRLIIAAAFSCSALACAAPVTTAFTYQGRLNDGGVPASGTYDFQFRLLDAETGGVQIGSTLQVEDLATSSGLFTTSLDFGAGAFTGDGRWLEISVRPGAGTDPHTVLSPRQHVTPAPHATVAVDSTQLGGELPSSYARLSLDQSFSGRQTFTAAPSGAGVTDGTVTVNPSSAPANGTLIGAAVGGSSRFSVDAEGDLAAASGTFSNGVTVSGGTLSATVGGDLTGSLPSPQVSALRGRSVSNTAPGTNQVLSWNGSQWVPATLPTVVTDHGGLTGLTDDDHPQYLLASGARALAGNLSAAGYNITNLGSATASGEAVPFQQAIKSGDSAGGDLAGNYPSPTVAGLRGQSVASTVPSAGQVLTYSGTQWTPQKLPIVAWARVNANGTVDSGSGLTVVHNGVGDYTLTLTSTPPSGLSIIPSVTAEIDSPPGSATTARLCYVNQLSSGSFYVYVTDGNHVAVNNDFVVIVAGQ